MKMLHLRTSQTLTQALTALTLTDSLTTHVGASPIPAPTRPASQVRRLFELLISLHNYCGYQKQFLNLGLHEFKVRGYVG